MKKPCKNCPFKRGNYWVGGVNWKLIAWGKIERLQIFSCHMHNDINVASKEDMIKNDCAGFRQMEENMKTPNLHPKIVNHYNETSPTYDITEFEPDWKHSKYLLPIHIKPNHQ